MRYSTLIVDDERPARTTLRRFLVDYLPQITDIFEAESVARAIEILQTEPIDIVLLDIQMPQASGFELIRFLSTEKQQVIFVTAFSDYTYEAIKASAVDYLMKPVMIEELIAAVNKTIQRIETLRLAQQQVSNAPITHLLERLHAQQQRTISIHHLTGFDIVETNAIVYLEASKSYTLFHLTDHTEIVASRNIAYFEVFLGEPDFFRIHKTYLINRQRLKGYSAIDGHFAILEGGKQLPVSKRRLNDFLKLSKT